MMSKLPYLLALDEIDALPAERHLKRVIVADDFAGGLLDEPEVGLRGVGGVRAVVLRLVQHRGLPMRFGHNIANAANAGEQARGGGGLLVGGEGVVGGWVDE